MSESTGARESIPVGLLTACVLEPDRSLEWHESYSTAVFIPES
jgi:hypothetical protein